MLRRARPLRSRRRRLPTARSALVELQSDAKRARVEEADDDPPPLTNELPCQWGLGTFRTQEQWTAKRRAKPITEGAKQVTIQRGDTGYMEHPRRGLIGAVQDWARGSKANVVKILLRLTKWFGVQDEMREKLGVEQSRAAKLDKEIVDRAAAALQLLKPCANLEQTHNYKVAAPPVVVVL